jgi:hypothetical protein
MLVSETIIDRHFMRSLARLFRSEDYITLSILVHIIVFCITLTYGLIINVVMTINEID